jgi:MFS family permease
LWPAVVSTPLPEAARSWRSSDVWNICFSAFFADLGYQAILAIFPLYLVIHLGAPIWLYGLSQALAYGPGALFGYAGGILAERYGRWLVAVLGNAFIPLMALAGLPSAPALAVGLLVVGWWARNLRTPPRRAMLVDSVSPRYRGEAFGFLHALDVGGGMLAAAYALLLVLGGVSYGAILLVTILPLAVSTLVLLRVRVGRTAPPAPTPAQPPVPAGASGAGRARSAEGWVFWGIMTATVLYGFASFSIGFPVLTTARATQSAALGILVFLVALGVSAATGLVVGRLTRRRVIWLALGGYLVAAIGSGIFAAAAATGAGVAGFLLAAGVLGGALGAVETFEPTLIAAVSPPERTARSMGSLTAFRSVGLFVSNLVLGLLTLANAWSPYVYAALSALAATLVLLVVARRAGTLGDVRAS